MQERKLMELAEAAGNIAIVGHVRPDGDCVGSCLAVCNYITEQYPEKTVDVYLETPPEKFSYLKQFERICSDPDTGNQYDLCICLDRCTDHTDFRYPEISMICASVLTAETASASERMWCI